MHCSAASIGEWAVLKVLDERMNACMGELMKTHCQVDKFVIEFRKNIKFHLNDIIIITTPN